MKTYSIESTPVGQLVHDEHGFIYGLELTTYEAVKLVDRLREEDVKRAEDKPSLTEVLDIFFANTVASAMIWYGQMQKQYRNNYQAFLEDHRNDISKQDFEMIRSRQLEPRQGCGKSIREILMDDAETKKTKLLHKIAGKVGAITDVDLYDGIDGTPNGVVTGTLGSVAVSTIIAEGYVQKAHYRVLVK